MRNTAHRLPSFEIVPHDDGNVYLHVFIPYCLNNIGQRFTELMESYKFFYYGLDASDNDIEAYKKTVELRFPYSQAFAGAERRHFALSLLNANFILNTMELVTEELIEILVLLTAVRLAKVKGARETIANALHNRRKSLLQAKFPRLIETLEEEVGPLTFKTHITSINSLRRTLVHRAGVVDTDELRLTLYVPAVFADNDFFTLSRPDYRPSLERTQILPKEVTVVWKREQEAMLDYELCFRILFTVVSFFGHVVNKAIPLKYPELEVANQAL